MAVNATKNPSSTKYQVPVYEVRLVQSRRPLRLAEECLADARTSARALHALIGLTDREHFACLFVNVRHHVTGAHIAAIGAQHTVSCIDVRVVLRAALAACASAIILGHNHPSGSASPSAEDIATTETIMRAANIVAIPVLDHIIVTRDMHHYHSMSEQGTLPKVPA
jgi:DNA repair protein RadC